MEGKSNEELDISRPSPSLGWLLGGLVPVIVNVGRAVAVVGALVTGFYCLSGARFSHDWQILGIAGATFVGLVFACRR